MTQFEKIKEEISNIDNPMEFTGYMDGLRTAISIILPMYNVQFSHLQPHGIVVLYIYITSQNNHFAT